ncbi:MAG: carbon storage regulator CsrA [Verrucomicrobiota bacterium]
MLILSRKLGESIVIDGRITVKVMRVDGDVVKIGIEAPMSVPVHRQEVYEEIQRSNQQALLRQSAPLPKLTRAPKTGAAAQPAPKTNLPKRDPQVQAG